jgi:hypothetical protein
MPTEYIAILNNSDFDHLRLRIKNIYRIDENAFRSGVDNLAYNKELTRQLESLEATMSAIILTQLEYCAKNRGIEFKEFHNQRN